MTEKNPKGEVSKGSKDSKDIEDTSRIYLKGC